MTNTFSQLARQQRIGRFALNQFHRVPEGFDSYWGRVIAPKQDSAVDGAHQVPRVRSATRQALWSVNDDGRARGDTLSPQLLHSSAGVFYAPNYFKHFAPVSKKAPARALSASSVSVSSVASICSDINRWSSKWRSVNPNSFSENP